MQEVCRKRFLPIREKMQIRPWLSLTETKSRSKLQIQNKIVWSIYKTGILSIRIKVQFHSLKSQNYT